MPGWYKKMSVQFSSAWNLLKIIDTTNFWVRLIWFAKRKIIRRSPKLSWQLARVQPWMILSPFFLSLSLFLSLNSFSPEFHSLFLSSGLFDRCLRCISIESSIQIGYQNRIRAFLHAAQLWQEKDSEQDWMARRRNYAII